MKFVVSGALGHIGSSLIRALPSHFDIPEIVLIDNMSAERYCSLFHLPETAHYRFIRGDILDMELDSIVDGADAFIHLAAITNAESSFFKAEEVETVNYDGTRRVAEICEKHKIPFIFPSSTSVYGSTDSVVHEESTLRPQSPYADSKIKSETFLKAREKLPFVIFRFGTIFGTSPGMRFHTAVNKFIWQACVGEPVTVWETAYTQKRPYLHIDDAVRAICFVIRQQLFQGDVYNVVTCNQTVQDITDEIRRHIPGLQITYVDSKIMNQLSYDVTAEKLGEKGFTPQGDLSEGIAKTIDLFRGLLV